ncbi:MAG: hypothetical protein HY902_04190, partial [Deltaproteobacteria bacterium]|nr:hypothetical protein [Deltaproteobacteria bacterium]
NCTLAGQLCVADVCQDAVCTPGTLLCQGNTVVQCGADGQSAIAVKACPLNQFCQDGVCQAQICTPGKPTCDGNAIKTCNGDGSGYVSGSGKDCGDLKCIGGACKAPICTPNKTYCVGNQIFMCAGDGYSGKLVKECGSSAACEAGSCKPLICEPYQSLCQGNVAKQCNATGTDFAGPGIDCGTSKCAGGMCKNQLCPPASQFCEDGKLKICSADGMSIASEKACSTGTYCGIGAGGTAECLNNKCSPGAVSCSGSVIVTCNGEGSGYLAGGLDCASKGQICAGGVCSSLQCDPKTLLYCSGNVVMMCDGSGMKPTAIQTCSTLEYCSNGTCFAKVCSPGGPACSGDFATTCNALGDGYVGAKVDCKAQGKACSGGACVAVSCGDGKVNQSGEQCDDGNKTDGDGCSLGCQVEATCNPACPLGLTCQADGSCAKPCGGADCAVKGDALLPKPVAGLIPSGNGVSIAGINLGAQLPNLWIANSPQNTVSRIDTKAAVEIGRYSVCSDPSRTAVDFDGNAWIACRGDGKVAKIIADKKKCIDKNGNGLIETSTNNQPIANDECVQFIAQPNKGTYARGIGVDRDNHAWVGYWNSMSLVRLNKDTGGTMDDIALGCSPYGLVIDQQGLIWLQGAGCGGLVRVDPVTKIVTKKEQQQQFAYPAGAYGINVDQKGRIWVASGNSVSCFDPKTLQWKVVNMQWGGGRGLATSDDGFVYVAVDGSGGAVKINGNTEPPQVVGFIKGAGSPVGAAVDYDGNVWVVNQSGSSTSKLDPKTMAAIATVPVGSSPYTYSDMTGYGLRFVGPFTKQGTWVGTFYAPTALGPYATATQVTWTAISVDVTIPGATTVQLKTAPTQATLAQMSWSSPVPFGIAPSLDLNKMGAVTGPWLQVQVTMQSDPKGGTPVLQGVWATAAVK